MGSAGVTSRLWNFLGPLGLVLASTLVALAIGEVLARLAFPPVAQTLDEPFGASGAYEEHPVYGWRPRPNINHRSRRFGVTYTTNSRGLRDREHSLERSPGLRRIVVVGDSFTWGYGVHVQEGFPEILESRMRGTEIVNLGVTAFGLRQEFDYLKLEGVLYRPDIVILALCQNDIYRDSKSLQDIFRASAASRSKRTASGLFGPVKVWLAHRLVLYGLAQQAINTNRPLVKTLVTLGLKEGLRGFDGLDTNLVPALRTYPPELQASFEATEAELIEIRDWLVERKIRFILALIPALQAIDTRAFQHSISYTVFEPSDFDLGKPYRNLEAFARTNGIEVINTYPALKRRQESGASLYLRNDVHFNAAGHEAFAAEILGHLQRSE
jgi:lysophospholipase L1-like esterase